MKLKMSYNLCVLFMILTLTACNTASIQNKVSPAEKSMKAAADPVTQRSIEGIWEGLIIQGAALTYIRLELDPVHKSSPSWQYTGKAYAQSFDGYLNGYSVTQDIHAENVPIRATYDPQIRTFHLQAGPGGRHGRLGLSTHLRNIGGVFDVNKDALAGLRQGRIGVRNSAVNTGNQYFLFLRPSRFKSAVKTFERLQGPQGRRKLPGIALQANAIFSKFSRFGGPGADKLRSWVQPLYDEYPELDLYRSAFGRFELDAVKLFRDGHFKKYFKKPFDELSVSELGSIQRALISLKQKSRNTADRSTSVLDRMFWTGRGDNAAIQTALWVKAQRYMLNWHNDRIKSLANLPDRKQSLEYTDRIEKEIEKTAGTLLWPSELAADKQHLADARRRIAFPALQAMLAEFESTAESPLLMNRLASWRSNEDRLFSFLGEEQARSLLDASDKRLDDVIAKLLPPYNQRILTLGRGMDAVENGNAWYKDVTAVFALVLKNRQVQESMKIFKQQRRKHLDQAKEEMLARVRQGWDQLPEDFSKSADGARLDYIAFLRQSAKKWFPVPGDRESAAVGAVNTLMAELGGRTAGLLPPRLVHSSGFSPQRIQSADRQQLDFFRSKVDPFIALNGSLADQDHILKSIMQRPIRDAGFQFKSNVVWALFHGRFDELDTRYYKGSGIGSDTAGGYLGENSRFHYAFVTYIGLSSVKHGRKQIGPAVQVSWKTKQGGEIVREGYGKVWMPRLFFPYYERSYKLAKKVSTTDAMFGSNGLGFLQMMLDMRSGKGFSTSGVRPDGEFQFARAHWEKDIMEDLRSLLAEWPQRSYGLWQLQENIARYLKNRPSMQSLYL